jgi:transposase InsO family protein
MRSLSEANHCSYGKVYRLRKENGLMVRRKQKPVSLTKPNPRDQQSEDLIKRDFTATEPGVKWLGDITQAQCKDGKLYICGVLDCFDGAIVGVSMREHMRTELCLSAMESAVLRYDPPPGLIFHSDRGSQYTSKGYRSCLQKYQVCQSMGRTGSCYDNARMESFWATLKNDLLYRLPLSTLTREQVRRIVFRWIECYYNQERLYSANPDYLPPLAYRQRWLALMKRRAA